MPTEEHDAEREESPPPITSTMGTSEPETVGVVGSSQMTFQNATGVHQYDITPDDILWLARAVEHEGQPYSAVAWALLQRFAWIYPIYPTLGKFVRAYAQPINPRWFPDGDRHLRELARLRRRGIDTSDELARANRRVGYSEEPWASLDRKNVVLDILAGRETSPVQSAVHYRAGQRSGLAGARRYAQNHNLEVVNSSVGYGPGVNWFFRIRQTRNIQPPVFERGASPFDESQPGEGPC